MATKPKPKASKVSDAEAVKVLQQSGECPEQLAARVATSGTMACAAVLTAYARDSFSDPIPVSDTYLEIETLGKASAAGDLAAVEKLLAAQVVTLNSVFTGLAIRSKTNSQAGYLAASETYMRLALRAQSQCRQTAQTLFEMKHPRPVAFVQQANISHGPQQVVNGGLPASTPPAHAEQKTTEPSKLLEASDGEWLDTGTARQAGRTHQDLAPGGAGNRAKV